MPKNASYPALTISMQPSNQMRLANWRGYSRVFNDYPVEDIFGKYYTTQFCNLLQDLMLELRIEEGEFAESESPKHASSLQSLISQMVMLACEDLLDDTGHIKPEIVRLFRMGSVNALEILMGNKEIDALTISKQFVYSYLTQLLLSYLFEQWFKKQQYQDFFLEAVVPVQDLINHYQLDLVKNNVVLSAAKQVLDKVKANRNYLLGKAYAAYDSITQNKQDQADILAENFTANWEAITTCVTRVAKSPITAHENFVTVLSAHFDQHANSDFKKYKQTFITAIRTHLQTLSVSEHKHAATKAIAFMTRTLEKAIDFKNPQASLHQTVNDYQVYGYPVVTHFKTVEIVNSDRELLISKLADDQKTLSDLSPFFQALVKTNAPDRAFVNFAHKIILSSFANLLTAEGKLQNVFQGPDATPATVCAYYIDVLIDNMTINWLIMPDNQAWYINHANKDHLKSILNRLMAQVRVGITAETLQKIAGFPFVSQPRAAESTFVFSIIPHLEQPIDRDTRYLIEKLEQIKAMIGDLEIFLQGKSANTDQLLKHKYTCEDLIKSFNANAKMFARCVNLEDTRKVFSIAEIQFNEAIGVLQGNYNTLYQLVGDLKSNRLTEHFNQVTYQQQITQLQNNIGKILQAAESAATLITKMVKPLLEKRAAAIPVQAEILTKLTAILNNETYWHKRVGGLGTGGKTLHKKTVPTLAASLATQLNHRLPHQNVDEFLFAFLTHFDELNSKRLHSGNFFTRPLKEYLQSEDTNELYAIINELKTEQNVNIYAKNKLEKINSKLAVFLAKQQKEMPHAAPSAQMQAVRP